MTAKKRNPKLRDEAKEAERLTRASNDWFNRREEAILPFRRRYRAPATFELAGKPGLTDFLELERYTAILADIGPDAPQLDQEDADFDTVTILGFYQRAREPIPWKLFRLVAKRLKNDDYALKRKRVDLRDRICRLANKGFGPQEIARQLGCSAGYASRTINSGWTVPSTRTRNTR